MFSLTRRRRSGCQRILFDKLMSSARERLYVLVWIWKLTASAAGTSSKAAILPQMQFCCNFLRAADPFLLGFLLPGAQNQPNLIKIYIRNIHNSLNIILILACCCWLWLISAGCWCWLWGWLGWKGIVGLARWAMLDSPRTREWRREICNTRLPCSHSATVPL